MPDEPTRTSRTSHPLATWLARQSRPRIAAGAALFLLACVALPVIPILLGVVVIVAVAFHAWSPDLRPWVQPFLQVPVGRPAERHTRLLLFAGAGIALVVAGYVGATVRARLGSELGRRERQREVAHADVDGLLEQAREYLAAGDVGGAEFTLLRVEGIGPVGEDKQTEVDELLERLRRSGDEQAILGVLTRLPQEEFEAFTRGESVPEALEFPERALTVRAVQLAHAQIDAARARRTRR